MSLLNLELSNNDRVAAFAVRDCCAHYPAKHLKIVLQFQNDSKLFTNRCENKGPNLCLSESRPGLS